MTIMIVSAALTGGIELAASLGINAMPLVVVQEETVPPSLGLLAVEGVSLLTASFWQTVLALQVPLVFLLLSFGLVFFTGGVGNLLALMRGRRRYYSVVMLSREDRLSIYAEPRPDSEIVQQVLPTARSLFGTGRPTKTDGIAWRPVEALGASGWAQSRNLVEEMDYETFLADKRPARSLVITRIDGESCR